jgi:hypothetical protein
MTHTPTRNLSAVAALVTATPVLNRAYGAIRCYAMSSDRDF